MSKRYSGKSFKDSSVSKKAKFSLKEGDVLTESYIRKIKFKKNKNKAHQYNRRTSFKVLREDYVPLIEKNEKQ